MHPITQQNINSFLDCKSMAIAGASRNPKSFSAEVAKHLSGRGYELWYINPAFGPEEKANNRVPSVAQLPAEVQHLLVLTPARQTEAVVKEALDKGMKHIWIQQQSDTPASIDMILAKGGVNLIHSHCIFMFSQAKGVHRFHRGILKFFGALPK